MNEFQGYDQSHEDFMRLYFRSLPEDHRRRYATVEALKIGFGVSRMWREFSARRCSRPANRARNSCIIALNLASEMCERLKYLLFLA